MNKILIISKRLDDRDQLENILQEIVDVGGELLFAATRKEGLEIFKKEHPQLVFIDYDLVETSSEWEGSMVVWMGLAHELPEVGNILVKPFIPRQVLDKCQVVLGEESVGQIPPM